MAKKYGFIDKSGKVVIEPQFDIESEWDKVYHSRSGAFSEGLALVKKDGKWGFIDKNGKMVIEPQFDEAGDFFEGFACVEKDGKWGFIDKSGKMVIEPQFDYPGYFSEGLAQVIKDGKYGYIDKSGKVVIEPQFDRVRQVFNFSEGLAQVEKDYYSADNLPRADDYNWGYIDKNGKVVIEPQFNYVSAFSEGLALVKKDGKWGFIDKNGKMVIEPQFDNAREFSEGFAGVEKDRKWGFIDKSGKMVIEPQFDEVSDFSEGLAQVNKGGEFQVLSQVIEGGKWGFIDKSGKVLIEPQFDHTRDFSEGFAQVKKDGKYGFIDKSGKVVIEPQFRDAEPFSEGFARVAIEVEGGVGDVKITIQGRRITTFSFACLDDGYVKDLKKAIKFTDGLDEEEFLGRIFESIIAEDFDDLKSEIDMDKIEKNCPNLYEMLDDGYAGEGGLSEWLGGFFSPFPEPILFMEPGHGISITVDGETKVDKQLLGEFLNINDEGIELGEIENEEDLDSENSVLVQKAKEFCNAQEETLGLDPENTTVYKCNNGMMLIESWPNQPELVKMLKNKNQITISGEVEGYVNYYFSAEKFDLNKLTFVRNSNYDEWIGTDIVGNYFCYDNKIIEEYDFDQHNFESIRHYGTGGSGETLEFYLEG